jgi:glycosyltransferase involved in cell wall biosynthesis
LGLPKKQLINIDLIVYSVAIMPTQNVHLVLFFTKGVSLKTWADNGSLNREIAVYLRLQEKGVKVSFVTYGNGLDLQFAHALRGINILCNNWNLSAHLYEKWMPWLHAITFRRAGVIKTNQMHGSEIAFRVARIWRKPLIARCGFIMSEWAEFSGKFTEAEQARRVERVVFPGAQRVVVSAPRMKEYIIQQYAVPSDKIQVIPNYVLTDVFAPRLQVPPNNNQICFIGRLSEEKNLPALIQACEGLDVKLTLIGGGHLHAPLQELAAQLGVQVSIPGNLPHHQLPDIIHQSSLFALVSPHEGHPKSLLEAMSCGIAVLGADSPGIREQIIHDETGWLCGTDAQSIRAGIRHLLANPILRERLGRNARRFIEKNYSLERIVEMEFELLQRLHHGEEA